MKGGLAQEEGLPNLIGTCVIDAVCNSIMNSKSICELLSKDISYTPDKMTKILHDNQNYFKLLSNSKNIKKHFFYLMQEYVCVSKSHVPERNKVLSEIRNRLLYLYNYSNDNIIITDIAQQLDDDYKECYEGANNSIIEQILGGAYYRRIGIDENIDDSLHGTDMYISFRTSDILERALTIDNDEAENITSLLNSILDIHGEYICTDAIITQWAISDSKPKHVVYYNVLTETMQNDDAVYHIPINELKYENVSNIKEIITSKLNNNEINVLHFDTENIFSIFIVECAHFQKLIHTKEDIAVFKLSNTQEKLNYFTKNEGSEPYNISNEFKLVRLNDYTKKQFFKDYDMCIKLTNELSELIQKNKKVKYMVDDSDDDEHVLRLKMKMRTLKYKINLYIDKFSKVSFSHTSGKIQMLI